MLTDTVLHSALLLCTVMQRMSSPYVFLHLSKQTYKIKTILNSEIY